MGGRSVRLSEYGGRNLHLRLESGNRTPAKTPRQKPDSGLETSCRPFPTTADEERLWETLKTKELTSSSLEVYSRASYYASP